MIRYIAVIGDVNPEFPDYAFGPYREDRTYDAVVLAPGATAPEGLPEWVPIIDWSEDNLLKRLRAAIKRWSITVEEAFEIRGTGTVIVGTLMQGRLRANEPAVREGFDRSMRIRELRVDGKTREVVVPGERVSILFGPVPVKIFKTGTVLRPGRLAKEKARIEIASDLQQAILDQIGDLPIGKGTSAICKALDKTPQQLGDVFEALRTQGKIVGFAGQWISAAAFEVGTRRFLEALDELHEKSPQQPSHPAVKVVGTARLGWSGKSLDRIVDRLAEKGSIVRRDEEIRRPRFRVMLGTRQRAFLDRLIEELERAGVNTPNAYELSKRLPAPSQAIEEILQLGEDVGELVLLEDGVIYSQKQIAELRERIRSGTKGKPFSLADMRDSFGTSRRYAVALLEYLDTQGFTERRGEERVIKG